MSHSARWYLFQGIFVALVIAATFYKVEGAGNIVTVLIGLMGVCSTVMLSEQMIAKFQERQRPVPAWVDVGSDLFVSGVLLWHGWMWLGSIWLFHTLMYNTARDIADKRRAKAEPEQTTATS